MLRFLIDKLREQKGPLKSARLLAGDIIEEAVDIASHYIGKIRGPQTEEISEEVAPSEPASATPTEPTSKPAAAKPATKSAKPSSKPKKTTAAKKTKAPEKKPPKRTIDVPDELAKALENPSNQKKQAFKVLAILWDARRRNNGGMSAKDLAAHGGEMGLAIRHENIRKVIKMRLSGYVDILQERDARSSVYHYRLNDEGMTFFAETYLK